MRKRFHAAHARKHARAHNQKGNHAKGDGHLNRSGLLDPALVTENGVRQPKACGMICWTPEFVLIARSWESSSARHPKLVPEADITPLSCTTDLLLKDWNTTAGVEECGSKDGLVEVWTKGMRQLCAAKLERFGESRNACPGVEARTAGTETCSTRTPATDRDNIEDLATSAGVLLLMPCIDPGHSNLVLLQSTCRGVRGELVPESAGDVAAVDSRETWGWRSPTWHFSTSLLVDASAWLASISAMC